MSRSLASIVRTMQLSNTCPHSTAHTHTGTGTATHIQSRTRQLEEKRVMSVGKWANNIHINPEHMETNDNEYANIFTYITMSSLHLLLGCFFQPHQLVASTCNAASTIIYRFIFILSTEHNLPSSSASFAAHSIPLFSAFIIYSEIARCVDAMQSLNCTRTQASFQVNNNIKMSS